MVALTVTGMITIPVVVLLSAVFGLANAAEMPIRQSFVAELVPRETIPNAVVLMQTAFSTSRMTGPVVAGVVVAGFGFTAAFAVAAGLSLTCVVLLSVMDRRSIRTAQRRTGETLASSLLSGARYVGQTAIVRDTLVVVCGTTAFGLSILAIMPIFAVDVLGLDSWGYGALLAALGAGTVVGAACMTFVGAPRARVIMSLGLACLAALLGAVAVTLSAAIAFVLMLLVGFVSMTVFSSTNVTVQTTVDHEVRGRVMGLYVAIYSGGAAAGALLVGIIAEAANVHAAIAVSAIGVAVVALWAFGRITRPALALQKSIVTNVDGSVVNRS
jgi:predicted MFS family arabinose efflux permease